MKTLILLRHGKAEADSPNGDHGRELADRGRKDVPAVVKHIKHKPGCPDLIVSSGAVRALQTAKLAAETLGYKLDPVEDDDIYEASAGDLLAIVRGLPNKADSVMLVGHNPGFEGLAHTLANARHSIPSMPTSGLVWLELPIKNWDEIKAGEGDVKGSYHPS